MNLDKVSQKGVVAGGVLIVRIRVASLILILYQLTCSVFRRRDVYMFRRMTARFP